MPTVDVRLVDVVKRYGEAVVVDHINLEVQTGEFFTLLGPSGCGKTTTLRMIGGFEAPTSGLIELKGEDVTWLPPYKRHVNTVFQNYALFPHLTIYENVAFGLRRTKVSDSEIKTRVTEMLKLVELPGYERRKPTQLSGGQAQRVALARALINRPSVLLLDEPLGALDLKLRKQMQIELKRIQQEVGITFIFVTHDQEEAMTMSDRIAVMNHGQYEQLGEPASLYERPRTRFVAGFLGRQQPAPDDPRRHRRRLRRVAPRRRHGRPRAGGLDRGPDSYEIGVRPGEDPPARTDRPGPRRRQPDARHRPRRVVPRRVDELHRRDPRRRHRSTSTSRTSSAPRAPSCGSRAKRSASSSRRPTPSPSRPAASRRPTSRWRRARRRRGRPCRRRRPASRAGGSWSAGRSPSRPSASGPSSRRPRAAASSPCPSSSTALASATPPPTPSTAPVGRGVRIGRRRPARAHRQPSPGDRHPPVRELGGLHGHRRGDERVPDPRAVHQGDRDQGRLRRGHRRERDVLHVATVRTAGRRPARPSGTSSS